MSNFIRFVEKVFYHLKTNDGILLFTELERLYKRETKSRNFKLDTILEHYPQLFDLDDDNYVSLKTDLRICKDYLTTNGCSLLKCNSLHICKFYICKTCTFKDLDCQFGHDLNGYNQNILDRNDIGFLKKDDLFYLLKRNDPTFIPLPCKFYNNSSCSKSATCPFLHICQFYLKNQCQFNLKCKRSHNVFDIQPKAILIKYGVDIKRSPKDVLTQLRIALCRLEESVSVDKAVDDGAQSYQLTANSELCLFFIHGSCKYGHCCRYIHVKTPYAWFYYSILLNAWFLFEKQDTLEKYYCDPGKTECYSEFSVTNKGEDIKNYVVLVNFLDWSLKGPSELQVSKVCRISTPSVGISNDKIAACWVWYWQCDDLTWKEYGEEDYGHKADLTSSHIEKLYCCFKKSGKLEFTTNKFSYNLCFDTLQQISTLTNNVRNVRRRPLDIQKELEHHKSIGNVKVSRYLSHLKLAEDESDESEESD